MWLWVKHMSLLENVVVERCVYGAASRLVEVGDVIIIMTYAQLNEMKW